jgi:hypothetical protein
VNGHEKIAKSYIADGTADDAIPPLKALIYIMANGEYKDMKVNDEKFRDLFKYEYVINSDWYKERLMNKQEIEIRLMERKIDNLQKFIEKPINESILIEFGYKEKLILAKEKLEFYKSDKYLKSLEGTIGADNISLR